MTNNNNNIDENNKKTSTTINPAENRSRHKPTRGLPRT